MMNLMYPGTRVLGYPARIDQHGTRGTNVRNGTHRVLSQGFILGKKNGPMFYMQSICADGRLSSSFSSTELSFEQLGEARRAVAQGTFKTGCMPTMTVSFDDELRSLSAQCMYKLYCGDRLPPTERQAQGFEF
eukprot:639211-Rhodomonas_salina.1